MAMRLRSWPAAALPIGRRAARRRPFPAPRPLRRGHGSVRVTARRIAGGSPSRRCFSGGFGQRRILSVGLARSRGIGGPSIAWDSTAAGWSASGALRKAMSAATRLTGAASAVSDPTSVAVATRSGLRLAAAFDRNGRLHSSVFRNRSRALAIASTGVAINRRCFNWRPLRASPRAGGLCAASVEAELRVAVSTPPASAAASGASPMR